MPEGVTFSFINSRAICTCVHMGHFVASKPSPIKEAVNSAPTQDTHTDYKHIYKCWYGHQLGGIVYDTVIFMCLIIRTTFRDQAVNGGGLGPDLFLFFPTTLFHNTGTVADLGSLPIQKTTIIPHDWQHQCPSE